MRLADERLVASVQSLILFLAIVLARDSRMLRTATT
jgi:hypothetical protein